MSVRLQLDLNEYTDAAGSRLAKWGADDILGRMWAKDHTVWSHELVPEIADRLGWLDLPERLTTILADLKTFGDELVTDQIAHVVVLGMGGSSLAPEVFAKTFGSAPGAPLLQVLDSTHPGAVLALAESIDISRTVFIIASKSGTTIEPLSFLEYFWSHVAAVTENPGRHFVATTDPGSKLEALAHERGFRRVFLAPPDVGGRYSALTEFGMVPAAAIGVDLEALQESAMDAQLNNAADATIAMSAGCRLGSAIGELALAGRDKITFLTSPDIDSLPAWIEQLIAESTGKESVGIVPIDGGPRPEADRDSFAVSLGIYMSNTADASMRVRDPYDVAGAMYVLEFATAVAGEVLGIHPFDQPDVQLAKKLASRAMEGNLADTGPDPVGLHDAALGGKLADVLTGTTPSYVALQAYLPATDAVDHSLEELRTEITALSGCYTTVGYGPRFLHSTGQLHKGGPPGGVFIQLIDAPSLELPVPETNYTFNDLIHAQAAGDRAALSDRGRTVVSIDLGSAGAPGIEHLQSILGA